MTKKLLYPFFRWRWEGRFWPKPRVSFVVWVPFIYDPIGEVWGQWLHITTLTEPEWFVSLFESE